MELAGVLLGVLVSVFMGLDALHMFSERSAFLAVMGLCDFVSLMIIFSEAGWDYVMFRGVFYLVFEFVSLAFR